METIAQNSHASNAVQVAQVERPCMVVRLLLLLVFCVVLPSCGKPSSDSVLTDFNEIFVKESERKFSFDGHRIYSGEGDTGNVYMHVKFRLTAIADAAVENGLFTVSTRSTQVDCS